MDLSSRERNVISLNHKLNTSGTSFLQKVLQQTRKKIDVVKGWPRPEALKDLRFFLGFASYNRRFVPQFANIARPLYQLISICSKQKNTQKSNKQLQTSWNEECTNAFEVMKENLTSYPVLGMLIILLISS